MEQITKLEQAQSALHKENRTDLSRKLLQQTVEIGGIPTLVAQVGGPGYGTAEIFDRSAARPA